MVSPYILGNDSLEENSFCYLFLVVNSSFIGFLMCYTGI